MLPRFLTNFEKTQLAKVKRLSFSFVLTILTLHVSAQITRFTYHDAARKNLKEVYQVKDTVNNILNGRYISYYLNGHIESKGQFVNNETTGVWEFYFETGNLRMRGILRQNSNYGLWEYFYENGVKSMEGTINGKMREGVWKIYYESGELKETGELNANKRTGIWKTFFEDGVKRGEIEYSGDIGKYTEYYHSGKVMAEGPKTGSKNVGHWRMYRETGELESEGEYSGGKKNGEWKYYYPSGRIASRGVYENDDPVGWWSYYYENGKLSASGEFVKGNRNGYWSSFHKDGSKKSEITYTNGTGQYREYYSSGNLRVVGQITNEKNQGKWQYLYEDGKIEGECDFDRGKGIYQGYYPSGALQTKGEIENDLRVGTWELFEEDGNLSGYYKPVYEDKGQANAINALIEKSKVVVPTMMNAKRKKFAYFTPLYPEYRSVIFQGNPAMMFVGSFPLGIEFYNETRLGHEFSFEGIRDPFFVADAQVPLGKLFKRGYTISLRQKFYNPIKTGMWYFGHELRFTNISHYENKQLMPLLVTVTAPEQRVEYGLLLGYRLMQHLTKDGITIDSFIGYGLGYRNVSLDPQFQTDFSSISTNHFSQTFHFGINIGYSFSFESSR
ncbi:MAG: hypothetical protein JST48_14655 [Bacteroidetes bacterium]|nr:hypothetical protein [Bacteroidota bacterium]